MIHGPQNDDELWEQVRTELGVVIPRRACCEGHTPPFTAFANAYFARSSISVWKGSRGYAGKSKLLATLSMAEATWLATEVLVLGGSAEQSENVIRYMDAIASWPGFPADRLANRGREQYGVTKARVHLANGGQANAVAASTKATRGPHPTRLRVDEADELATRVLDAALGTTMVQRGVAAQTVISSTHHYEAGTMSDVLDRAAANGWPVYEWCLYCTRVGPDNPTGWLTQAEIDRKRKEVPERMWFIEYELQAPHGSEGVIPRDWVHLANQRWREREAAGTLREGPFVIAGDVSGGGGDRAPFALRFGMTIAELIDLTPKEKDNFTPMADAVRDLVEEHGGVAAVDAIGTGSAVPTLLRERKVNVVAYKGSVKTKTRDRFGNFGFNHVRSAAYWNLRELLNPDSGHDVALPPSRELERQLCAPSYEIRAGAMVVVESKEDVIKRLGRSPDEADAVVIAFWADRLVMRGKLTG